MYIKGKIRIFKKGVSPSKKNAKKRRKIRIFPMGLVHRFDQKLVISSTLIFMQNRPRKSIWERSS